MAENASYAFFIEFFLCVSLKLTITFTLSSDLNTNLPIVRREVVNDLQVAIISTYEI